MTVEEISLLITAVVGAFVYWNTRRTDKAKIVATEASTVAESAKVKSDETRLVVQGLVDLTKAHTEEINRLRDKDMEHQKYVIQCERDKVDFTHRINGLEERLRNKQEDRQRQDVVAERLTAQNEKVNADAQDTKGQLKEVHGLVNSQLTASLNSELSGLRRELVLLEKIDGTSPEIIESTKKRIKELEDNLAERAKAEGK